MDGDIVIKGGTLIDGTGAERRRADVAIVDGRIAAVGADLAGERELDASGQVVAPGFIDIHTHYDAQVFWDPWLTPSSFHGVTSVIAGNCGFSIAPVRPENVDLLAHTLQHVEDMSFDTLSVGVPWREFETFPQYLDAVERRGAALNYGCYVGHTAVRLATMGEDAYDRPATDEELESMQATVAEAIDSGAMGFATSANPIHVGDRGRPVPSRIGDMNELRMLLEPLKKAGKGVVALLPGGVIPNKEVFRIQREIGRPITWTALLTVKGFPYHEKVIAQHDEARAEGVDVWPQVSCRPLVFQMTLEDPFTWNARPAFAKLQDMHRDGRVAAYGDPAWRAEAWEQMTGNHPMPVNWSSLSIDETDRRPDLIGRPVAEVAEELGCTPLDVVLDVSLEEDLATRIRCVLANDDPEGIAWLLPRDGVLLGLADSGAHVGQLCDACFATDLLGQWVRDKEVMPLERAVHKLTGEPAAVYGLSERGTLDVGKAADVCVFDPDTVGPGPLRRVRDFPADGERLTADAPVGVTHVLVNGVPIRADGEAVADGLDARPGHLLRA